MSAAAAVTPIEWLHSLGAFLNDFYEAQCKAVKAKVAAQKKTKITNNSKLQSSAAKAPQSTQKHLVRIKLSKFLLICNFLGKTTLKFSNFHAIKRKGQFTD